MRQVVPKNGFSLVELLACLAIVSVLASILIAVLSSTRRKSDLLGSVSNVRSIGGAAQLFAQENGGNIPVWHDYSSGQYWWQQLSPYLAINNTGEFRPGQYGVFQSPAHTEFDDTNATTLAQSISYGWNYVVMGRAIADPTKEGDHVLPVSLFPNPTETLILTDGPKHDCWGYISYDRPGDRERYGTGELVGLFLDGHVSMVPYEKLTTVEPYFIPIRELPPNK